MINTASAILKQQNILSHHNSKILIAKVLDADKGLVLAKDILYALVNKRTILYLSGGRTPKDLYQDLAKDEKLEAGALGLVDERFGDKWHTNSNEKMIRDTGFLRYLEMKDITFYPILQHGSSRVETAESYDNTIRSLHNVYQKSIGILGVGLDGHTAGIAGNRADFTNPMFTKEREHLLVSEFDDQKGMYKERVSMTMLGLSMLDFLLVLVFGDDKKEALEKMFSEGKEEEIPSRFFKRSEIAKKTLFITDQNV